MRLFDDRPAVQLRDGDLGRRADGGDGPGEVRAAGAVAPALDAVRGALAAAPAAHFDETGFRVADGLAWVHSTSSGKFVVVTVHGKRGMNAAGVLPAFGGIACHDA
jgi:transposase